MAKLVHRAINEIASSGLRPAQQIRNFKNERNPNVAVTVDLLTTGIDVPEIVNVVFLRRVKSRILYEQMMGRATRLCPEIDKENFSATVTQLPVREDITLPIEEQLIVELYSR